MSHIRISLLSAAALALALSATPLVAQEQAATPAADATPLLEADAATRLATTDEPTESKQKAKRERRICKSTAPTGTSLAKKTCLTQAQWEEAQRKSQDATNAVQTNQLLINRQGN